MTGFERINEANGWGIAITGMMIVFFALVLISLIIAMLPTLLAKLEPYVPVVHHHGHGPAAAADVQQGSQSRAGAAAAVAAAAFAVHHDRQQRT